MMRRVLVCGGRNYSEQWRVFDELQALYEEGGPFIVIEGGARGADYAACLWAQENERHGVQHRQFPADWDQHGKWAGPVRNAQMLREGQPDLVLAFPGGKGTAHMVSLAERAGVPVRVCGVIYGKEQEG